MTKPEQYSCNLAIADDHPIVWDGITLLLENSGAARVLVRAQNGAELLKSPQLKKCDILILDITMPIMDGFEVIEHLKQRQPELHILVYTMHNNQEFFGKCMGLGVKGYVLKRDPPETLLNAIKNILAGKLGISPSISPMLIDQNQIVASDSDPSKNTGFEALTSREIEVLSLVAAGHTSKSIARILDIKKPTADKHRENIRMKLGTNNIAEVIEIARKNNLI